jgi:hypothetical protein
MNNVKDIVIATQLSTAVAAAVTYCAHIIENGTILNANWLWAVYVLMGIAVIFMLVPHLLVTSTYLNIKMDVEDAVLDHDLDLARKYDQEHNSATHGEREADEHEIVISPEGIYLNGVLQPPFKYD